MDTGFATHDIYPLRYDSLGGTAKGHAGGTILFANGRGLNFGQNLKAIALKQNMRNGVY